MRGLISGVLVGLGILIALSVLYAWLGLALILLGLLIRK